MPGPVYRQLEPDDGPAEGKLMPNGSHITHRGPNLRHHGQRKPSTQRRYIAFAMIVSLLFGYLIWNSVRATDDDSTAGISYSGKTTIRMENIAITTKTKAKDKATQSSAERVRQKQQRHEQKQQQEKDYQQGLLPRSLAFVTSPLLLQHLLKIENNLVETSSISSPASNSSPSVTNAATAGGRHGSWAAAKSQNQKVVNESLVVCSEQFIDARGYIEDRPRREYDNLPVIYFVTPTYPRREQIAELTRLAHTLLHVPRIHWILANDLPTCNAFLDHTLNRYGIPYTHLSSPMPDMFRKKKPLPRGVANRRAAIAWLRHHNITTGVLYFGDDDNTYDLKLFKEIRNTLRVSMFPVGLIEEYSISGPVVRRGKVVGFLDSWVADRRWPVDMAGFAVSLAYMAEHPNASMPYKPGYEEDYFLRSIALSMDRIEPRGNNCTEVLVWHTQTKNHYKSTVRINHMYLDDRSNLGALFKALEIMGVSGVSDTDGKKATISKNGKAKSLDYFLS